VQAQSATPCRGPTLLQEQNENTAPLAAVASCNTPGLVEEQRKRAGSNPQLARWVLR
jgi:hypothetical protein